MLNCLALSRRSRFPLPLHHEHCAHPVEAGQGDSSACSSLDAVFSVHQHGGCWYSFRSFHERCIALGYSSPSGWLLRSTLGAVGGFRANPCSSHYPPQEWHCRVRRARGSFVVGNLESHSTDSARATWRQCICNGPGRGSLPQHCSIP